MESVTKLGEPSYCFCISSLAVSCYAIAHRLYYSFIHFMHQIALLKFVFLLTRKKWSEKLGKKEK